jgi:hypothetical protein
MWSASLRATRVVEFLNASDGDYFLTADAAEIATAARAVDA